MAGSSEQAANAASEPGRQPVSTEAGSSRPPAASSAERAPEDAVIGLHQAISKLYRWADLLPKNRSCLMTR